VREPRPIGSANLKSPAISFSSFGTPCVIMRHATIILNSRSQSLNFHY
jgi:hypothetical protein